MAARMISSEEFWEMAVRSASLSGEDGIDEEEDAGRGTETALADAMEGSFSIMEEYAEAAATVEILLRMILRREWRDWFAILLEFTTIPSSRSSTTAFNADDKDEVKTLFNEKLE